MQMLLLEGDDMNQKTGICILLCLVLLLVFGIWYQKSCLLYTSPSPRD